jgi:2-oxoglutarate dehydrogenase E2 component (dihydrolipoamide succinyltransferase)
MALTFGDLSMPIEIIVPEMGESIVEATVSRWLKQEGDAIAKGEEIVELETDKVNMAVAAPQAGVLTKIARQEEEDVEIGDVLAYMEAGDGPPETDNDDSTAAPPAEPASTPAPRGPKTTPMAEKIAAEKGVDLSQVSGSGVSGRITQADVTQAAKKSSKDQADSAKEPAPKQKDAPSSAPPFNFGRPNQARETRERMSRRRQTIARRLVEAQQTAAMLTTFNEVDMSAVMDLRKRRRDAFEERTGARLGFMSFFTKAVIGALKAFPLLNAEIDGTELILKHYYDIGIAVGAEDGLVVPVLRDADRMSFADIENEIRNLAKKARDGSLSLADLQGGTFTITNGGVFGSLLSTPILNPPQVGILGLHKIEDRPIALNGEVVIRPMMYLAMSYDHRIVDGSDAVRFLVRVKELMEDPEVLLLEG